MDLGMGMAGMNQGMGMNTGVNPMMQGMMMGNGNMNPGMMMGNGNMNPGMMMGNGNMNPGMIMGNGNMNPGMMMGNGFMNPGMMMGNGFMNPGMVPQMPINNGFVIGPMQTPMIGNMSFEDLNGWNLIFENQTTKTSIPIRISEQKYVKEAINMYRIKSGTKENHRYIFGGKELYPDMIICQSGLKNFSRILVISTLLIGG